MGSRFVITQCQGQALWIYKEYFEDFSIVRSPEDYLSAMRRKKKLFIKLNDFSPNWQNRMRTELLKTKTTSRSLKCVFAIDNDNLQEIFKKLTVNYEILLQGYRFIPRELRRMSFKSLFLQSIWRNISSLQRGAIIPILFSTPVNLLNKYINQAPGKLLKVKRFLHIFQSLEKIEARRINFFRVDPEQLGKSGFSILKSDIRILEQFFGHSIKDYCQIEIRNSTNKYVHINRSLLVTHLKALENCLEIHSIIFNVGFQCTHNTLSYACHCGGISDWRSLIIENKTFYTKIERTLTLLISFCKEKSREIELLDFQTFGQKKFVSFMKGFERHQKARINFKRSFDKYFCQNSVRDETNQPPEKMLKRQEKVEPSSCFERGLKKLLFITYNYKEFESERRVVTRKNGKKLFRRCQSEGDEGSRTVIVKTRENAHFIVVQTNYRFFQKLLISGRILKIIKLSKEMKIQVGRNTCFYPSFIEAKTEHMNATSILNNLESEILKRKFINKLCNESHWKVWTKIILNKQKKTFYPSIPSFVQKKCIKLESLKSKDLNQTWNFPENYQR